MSAPVAAWREAASRAPMGPGILHPDARVIERPGWYQLVTPSAPRGSMNEVYLSDVAEADVERVIDDVFATYAAIDQPVRWWVGPWTRPVDLGARLARRGLVSHDVCAMGRAAGARRRATPPSSSRPTRARST